jgi:hypothetical protein
MLLLVGGVSMTAWKIRFKAGDFELSRKLENYLIK